jgi:hypothetical protein
MDEKRDGIVIMLKGPELAHYTTHSKDMTTYDELIDGQKLMYTIEKQRSRLLRDWYGSDCQNGCNCPLKSQNLNVS